MNSQPYTPGNPMISMTVAEKVRLQREAYEAGAGDMYCSTSVPLSEFAASEWRRIRDGAARKFPLPKITQPRVVSAFGNHRYRVVDGVLESCGPFKPSFTPSGASRDSLEKQVRDLTGTIGGRERDIERAQQDIERYRADLNYSRERRAELEKILTLFDNPTEKVDA
jgi:hypothetical protein